MNLIEAVLRDYPETRENDKLLIMKVWEFQGLAFSESQKQTFLNRAKTPETIRRTRQRLQQDGRYPASKETDERRHELYIETKQNISEEPKAVSWL